MEEVSKVGETVTADKLPAFLDTKAKDFLLFMQAKRESLRDLRTLRKLNLETFQEQAGESLSLRIQSSLNELVRYDDPMGLMIRLEGPVSQQSDSSRKSSDIATFKNRVLSQEPPEYTLPRAVNSRQSLGERHFEIGRKIITSYANQRTRDSLNPRTQISKVLALSCQNTQPLQTGISAKTGIFSSGLPVTFFDNESPVNRHSSEAEIVKTMVIIESKIRQAESQIRERQEKEVNRLLSEFKLRSYETRFGASLEQVLGTLAGFPETTRIIKVLKRKGLLH